MPIVDFIYERNIDQTESNSTQRYDKTLTILSTMSLVLVTSLLFGCESAETPSQRDEQAQNARTSVAGSEGHQRDLGSALVDMNVMSSQGDADTLSELRDLPLITPPAGASVVEAEQQRAGDPEVGYDHFINAPFVSCGIPLSVFEEVGDISRFLPLVGLPAEQAYLEGRTGGNQDLPYFFTYNRTRSGVEIAAINCMSCHASVFDDQLVVGLGNTTLKTTSDVSIFANGLGRLISDPLEREAWSYWAERISSVGPATVLDTQGLVAADNMALVLFGRRDPVTLEWRDDYQIDVPDQVPTVPLAVPPLWRMGKKNSMFYSGAFRGDHTRYMFAASSLCLEDLDEFAEIDGYFHHVRAWIASLKAPPWPYEVEPTRARRGEVIFERTCSGCHGTYGADESYPNLVIPIEDVGTDPLLLAFEEIFVESLTPWFNLTFLRDSNYLVSTGGYMPPPLDGIWMTAPYLHNDSVPSLATLLDSSSRPRFWRRASLDSNDYDEVEMGWRYLIEERGRADGAGPEIYDTTRMGYLNEGHTYGDHLTPDQRLELIECLKTL